MDNFCSPRRSMTPNHFAHHSETYTHDVLNCYLRQDQITPAFVWDNVKSNLIPDENAYLLFDDTVLDKSHSFNIQSVHRQWSGNAGQVINDIGVVTCVYVNATLKRFWIIDYRIDTPDTDGKKKPAMYMLAHAIRHKRLVFRTMRMDSGCASKALMLQLHAANKSFFCPLKANRLVCDGPESKVHQPLGQLVGAMPKPNTASACICTSLRKGFTWVCSVWHFLPSARRMS